MMRKLMAGTFALLMLLNYSCDIGSNYEKDEKNLIQNYLNSVGDTVYNKTDIGLYYYIISEGTGRKPVIGDTVYIWYKAKYLTGQLFDTNIGQSESFGFVVGNGSVIKGIDEGVKLIRQGEKTKLVTPSSLAYGSQGLYSYNSYGYYYVVLPGYTPLVWNIEIDTVWAGSK